MYKSVRTKNQSIKELAYKTLVRPEVIHARYAVGEKSCMVFPLILRREVRISQILKKFYIFFLISGTFGSFWDAAAENKPILCGRVRSEELDTSQK